MTCYDAAAVHETDIIDSSYHCVPLMDVWYSPLLAVPKVTVYNPSCSCHVPGDCAEMVVECGVNAHDGQCRRRVVICLHRRSHAHVRRPMTAVMNIHNFNVVVAFSTTH